MRVTVVGENVVDELLESSVLDLDADMTPDGISLDRDTVAVLLSTRELTEEYKSNCGKHMMLTTPPGRHWHIVALVDGLTVHVLLLRVRGPKQSALAVHEPHAPAEIAPVGSCEVPAGTVLTLLHLW